MIYVSSHGFAGEYSGSTFGHSVSPVAKQDGAMQRDYWYSSNRKVRQSRVVKACRRKSRATGIATARRTQSENLRSADGVRSRNGGLAAAQLGVGDIGYSLYKGASFLAGKLSAKIGSEFITVIDDGTISGALGSRPFDAEGLPIQKKIVVEKGELKSYLLDTYSGKKLGCRQPATPRVLSGSRLASRRRISI